MTGAPLLAAQGLRKAYGAVPVLKGVDVALTDGEVLALIGPNGAGKTTLFKVLTGEIPLDAGSIRYAGAEIGREPAFARVRRGIGRTFQVSRVFLELTALGNVTVALERRRANRGEPVAARWHRVAPAAELDAEARRRLDEVGLAAATAVEARFLSHGDKKRLELAVALALEPRLLMLDEPTAGMARSDRRETVQLLARVRRERGLTLMMTEHDMDVVFGLADRVVVMNYGELVASGAPEAVRADPVVRAVYLGQEALDA